MEQKKVIWIVVSIGVFLLIVIGAGLFLTYQKSQGIKSNPAFSQVKPNTTVEPSDWVRQNGTMPTPDASQPETQGDGNLVIGYGEEPETTETESTEPLASGDTVTVNVTLNNNSPTLESKSTDTQDKVVSEPAIKTSTKASDKTQTSTTSSASTNKTSTTVSTKVTTSVNTTSTKAVSKTVTEYWIQASSYKTRTKAEDAKNLFDASGLKALITTKDIDGITWYRVRLGPYALKAEADNWLLKIKKIDGFSESYVSKETFTRTVKP